MGIGLEARFGSHRRAPWGQHRATNSMVRGVESKFSIFIVLGYSLNCLAISKNRCLTNGRISRFNCEHFEENLSVSVFC